jgi:hypothetical protein
MKVPLRHQMQLVCVEWQFGKLLMERGNMQKGGCFRMFNIKKIPPPNMPTVGKNKNL